VREAKAAADARKTKTKTKNSRVREGAAAVTQAHEVRPTVAPAPPTARPAPVPTAPEKVMPWHPKGYVSGVTWINDDLQMRERDSDRIGARS